MQTHHHAFIYIFFENIKITLFYLKFLSYQIDILRFRIKVYCYEMARKLLN